MADGSASAVAIAAGAPDGLWPLPLWLQAVAENPAYVWAVRAWRSAASVPGAWFDYTLADAIVAEWPEWARLTTDRFAGEKFVLILWQEIIVRLMVGWQRPTQVKDPRTHEDTTVHVRIFRKLLLWVPRKNGKTEFLAALALLFFTLDDLKCGEGYVFARDEVQAEIAFKKMKDMVARSPGLKDDLIAYKKSIYSKSMAANIQVLTGAEDGKHGKNPSVVVGDEMHEWRSLEVASTLSEGMGARLQPVELYASTTGRKSNLIGLGLWDLTQSIMNGVVKDPSTLAVIFAAPQDADFRDEEAWALANPSLGLSPILDFLRGKAAEAEGNPVKEARFRCYYMNQWIDPEVRWIPVKKWDACADPAHKAWKTMREGLIGRPCYGAFDVSSTQDITALVWAFPPTSDDPKWRLLAEFWVPEANVRSRVDNFKVRYDDYIADGALTTTPGDWVDQNYVAAAIKAGCRDFAVQKIGFDPWNARKLVGDLQTQDGLDADLFVEMRQGIPTLGEPTKQTETLIYSGVLDHGGHPVLRWMAENAVVRFDENLNYAPAKKKSGEKIDGIVATVMAVGLATCDFGEDAPVIGSNPMVEV